MEALYILAGFAVGFVIAWLLAGKKKSAVADPNMVPRAEKDELIAKLSGLEEKAVMLAQAQADLKASLASKDKQAEELIGQLASSKADHQNMQVRLKEQKEELENIRGKLNSEFRLLANEIMEEKSKTFTAQNREKLDEILKPLGEKIKDFEKKVEETYRQESRENFSLKEELKRLLDLNQQIGKEASNLANALKGQVKTQGNWGEMILESILEFSGLTKDREYVVQESIRNEDGERLQPDVIVHYPGERHVIIDSKVSLVAYERYCSAEDNESQELALRDHLISIRSHVTGLSGKKYQDLYKLNSPDFVMLFMPVEPAYLLAIQKDPGLWQFAYERRILLISPTNLIAALKLISSLWQQEYQNRNALEIARKGGDLYDKLVGFAEDLMVIKKKIDDAGEAWDHSMNKLRDGKGNLIRRAEEMKKLGITAKKNLPKEMLPASGETDLDNEE